MRKLFQTGAALFFFVCLVSGNAFCQKERITGHWKISDLKTDDYPAGIQVTMYDRMLKRADSSKIKMDKSDSLKLENLSKQFIEEQFGNIYFQFNPDETCVVSYEKGKIAKGRYKIKENENSITMNLTKDQNTDGGFLKLKGDQKQKFFYSFKGDILALDSDDGEMRYLLKKD